MLINFIGYRQSSVNRYRLISGIAMICLGTHFLLLDALAAAIGCYLAFARNIIAMRTQHVSIVVIFVLLNIAFLLYELLLLGHGPIILLAYTASITFTVGTFLLSSADKIRKVFLFAESCNLVYAIYVGSVMGTVGIVINIIGIVTKLWQDSKSHKVDVKQSDSADGVK